MYGLPQPKTASLSSRAIVDQIGQGPMGSLGEWERARRATIVAPLFGELAARFARAPP